MATFWPEFYKADHFLMYVRQLIFQLKSLNISLILAPIESVSQINIASPFSYKPSENIIN